MLNFFSTIANEPKPATTSAAPVKPVSNGYKFNFDLSFLGEFIQISLIKDESK